MCIRDRSISWPPAVLKNDYMGIARALDNFDTEHFETLRDGGVLTRDSRMKERKKPGLHGARRGTQFSKR